MPYTTHPILQPSTSCSLPNSTKANALFNTLSASSSIQNDSQNSNMSFKRAAQNLVVYKRLMSEASNVAPRYISPSQSLGELSHRVSSFERLLLVWSGKFKSLAEVPTSVSRDTMERSRDYFRIRLNVSLVLVGVFGALMMVISGKNAHHRGDSLQKQNMEWHKRYNETHTPH